MLVWFWTVDTYFRKLFKFHKKGILTFEPSSYFFLSKTVVTCELFEAPADTFQVCCLLKFNISHKIGLDSSKMFWHLQKANCAKKTPGQLWRPKMRWRATQKSLSDFNLTDGTSVERCSPVMGKDCGLKIGQRGLQEGVRRGVTWMPSRECLWWFPQWGFTVCMRATPTRLWVFLDNAGRVMFWKDHF